MKNKKLLGILAAVCTTCCFATGLVACGGGDGKGKVIDDKVQYTYQNPDAVLPDYDTDVITVDGKLDEDVYDTLRWWDADYPEDDGVSVRATSYAGEKGIFFIVDVDDYAVTVNPLRVSWENSGITVYVAKTEARTLNDDVWEIELCPDNSINAKCAIGGYHYSTIQPDGYKNKPFSRTVTKGGAVNTDDCLGYVIESYFSYEYLFGSEEKPEGYRINYALQRNSNVDKNHNRDTYYNFGENLLGAYNWNVPSTWWKFNDNGLDAVLISSSVTGDGKIEFADKFVSRYGTTTANIIPSDGNRIKSVTFGGKDVTSALKYDNGVNTLKLRNLAEDGSISAEFEAIPDAKSTVSGNVTFLGSALTEQQKNDLKVRVNIGGVVYESDVDADGNYSMTVANGNGTIEVLSKLGYSVKRTSIEIGADKTEDIALTADDYGNKRVITMDDEAVITSKVDLFNAADYIDTMNGTLTYAFNLKYNGTLLDGNGAAVDPTGGQYEHQYTSVNLYMTLKAGETSETLHLQLLRWDSQWRLKTSIGSKNKESAVDNELLRALGSEDGVDMLMILDNDGVSFYRTNGRGGIIQKILEIDFVNEWGMASKERKVSSIQFFCENVVDHNIWAVENNVISLDKTIDDYAVYEYYYQAKATLSESAQKLTTALGLGGDINHGAISGGLVDSFKIKASSVNANGVVSKDEQIVLNMLGCDEWLNRLNATLYLKKDGGSYIGMNLGSVTDTYRRYVLSDAQIKALGGDGLNVYLVQSTDNWVYSLYVADGNDLVHVRDIASDGKGKAYGYDVTYAGTNAVSIDTSAFAGETTDKLLERINAYTGTQFTQITEGTITEVVELVNNTVLSGTYTEAHGSNEKGTVIPSGKWDRGNSVWHYSAELSNFFANGSVSKDMTIKLNHFGTNEWGLRYWAYNVYFKLDAAANKATIEFQEGTNWTKSTYELTSDELSALAASGRLDFYAIRNSANKLALYIGNADGTVKDTSLVMDTVANFGVAELKVETLTYGAAVAVNCHNYYVDFNFAIDKPVSEIIAATCTNDAAPDKVRYIEHVAKVEAGHTTSGNIEYWMCDGKYYSDANATVEISQADTVIDPVGHNYDKENWSYSLTHHWHVCPDDGAKDEEIAHTPNANGICTVCQAPALGTLRKVSAKEPTCTEEGNTEYWTDGIYYFEDENHTIATTLEKVTLGKVAHTLDGDYVPDGNKHYKQCSVCREKIYSDHQYTDGQCACGVYEALTYSLLQTKKYIQLGSSGAWMDPWDNGNTIWHIGTLLQHALNTDGSVAKDMEVKIDMMSNPSDWSAYYQNNVIIKTNSAQNTITVGFQSSGGGWATNTHTLTQTQRSKITNGVLNIYVLHTNTDGRHELVLCLPDGDTIVKTNIKDTTSDNARYQSHRIETLNGNTSVVVDVVNFGDAAKKYNHPIEMLINDASNKFGTPDGIALTESATKTFSGASSEVYGYYDAVSKEYMRFGAFERSVARFIVKAPNALDGSSIKSSATVTMELLGNGSLNKWFGAELRLAESGSVLKFISHNDNNGSVFTETEYKLNDYQLSLLQSDGGLEIYIETDGAKRYVYIKSAEAELTCVSMFDYSESGNSDNKVNSFRISYAQAAYGATVSFDVADRGWNSVRDVIQSKFGGNYSVCWGEWSGVSKAQQNSQGKYELVKVGTGDIGGKSDSTFIHYNVKIQNKPEDFDDRIAINYEGWSQGLGSYNVSIRLKYDGSKFVLLNCGMYNGDWVGISGNNLSEALSAKAFTDEGLDFFFTQKKGDSKMILYVYDKDATADKLVKVCETCANAVGPCAASSSLLEGSDGKINDEPYTGTAEATIKIDWVSCPADTDPTDAVNDHLSKNA